MQGTCINQTDNFRLKRDDRSHTVLKILDCCFVQAATANMTGVPDVKLQRVLGRQSATGPLLEEAMRLCQVFKLLLKGSDLGSELLSVLHQLSTGPLRLLQLYICRLTLT